MLVTPYSGSPIVGAWGVLPPYPMILKTPPIKTDAPHGAPPHLKMKPLPSEKHPPLKHEAPFHEMIPRKSTINNNKI